MIVVNVGLVKVAIIEFVQMFHLAMCVRVVMIVVNVLFVKVVAHDKAKTVLVVLNVLIVIVAVIATSRAGWN
jgi:hypothetical protein